MHAPSPEPEACRPPANTRERHPRRWRTCLLLAAGELYPAGALCHHCGLRMVCSSFWKTRPKLNSFGLRRHGRRSHALPYRANAMAAYGSLRSVPFGLRHARQNFFIIAAAYRH